MTAKKLVREIKFKQTEELLCKFYDGTPHELQYIDVIYIIKVANEFPNQIINYPVQVNLQNTYRTHLQSRHI